MLIVRPLLYTVAAFLMIGFAWKKRDSKMLYNVVMFFCWIVIALSMDSNDIANYREAFDANKFLSSDPLYNLMQRGLFSMGLPFAVMKILYGTVIWALLYRALKHYTLDMALVAAIFVLGPMMGLGTQMRSSLAGMIVLNALPLLLKKDGKAWIYCLLILLASLVHMMALFYFVFLIPKLLRASSEKFRNILCIIALVAVPALAILDAPIAQLLKYMQNLTNISLISSAFGRLAAYFAGQFSPNIKGFLFNAFGHFVTFVLTDRMCAAMLQIRSQREQTGQTTGGLSAYAIEYLRKINSMLVLIIPCYVLSMQFDRFHNYFVPVCYCLIVQGAKEVLAVKRTVDGANFRIRQAGGSKVLRTAENGIWKLVDSKPVQTIGNGFRRIGLGAVLHAGNVEIALLLACLTLCFFVYNWYSGFAEFSRIVNGIGLFGGPG